MKTTTRQTTTLLPGIFKDSQMMGHHYLHHLEPDRLLAPCYEAIGLIPKAKRYGGWESMAIAGHSLGHYLSAIAQMIETTKDTLLTQRLTYTLNEMAFLQKKEGTGYISGFPRDCFDKVFSGDFEVERFSLGGSWVPWYSIHKIYAGLVDVYLSTGDALALDIVKHLADWSVEGTQHLSDEAFQRMLFCEFGGMNEVLAQLYEITGEDKYLKLARRFQHHEALDALSKGIDNLEGRHANTQIPKVLGAAKLYDVEGREEDYKTAEFFWDQVTAHRSYVIGGNSFSEHFVQADKEPLGVTTTETCNTYNMMKLSAYLHRFTGDSRYMAYYEKALFNHILASQDPDTGMKVYFVPTEPGHFKTYCHPDESFWCCTGSGMENPAKYHQEIYHLDDNRNRLSVDLFISSSYSSSGIALEQQTNFPYEKEVRLEITCWDRTDLTLALRVPPYLKQAPQLYYNQQEVLDTEIIDGYVSISNSLKAGDEIIMLMDYGLDLYTAMDDSNKLAFMYGPIVLAGALGNENYPDSDMQPNHLEFVHHPGIAVPMIVSDVFELPLQKNNILALLKAKDEKRLHFTIDGIGQPGNKTIDLIPFFELHHQRYTLYFQCMTQKAYENEATTSLTYQAWLKQVTIDSVSPHEQQSEIEHHGEILGTSSDYSKEAASGWRCAERGHFIRYQLKVEAGVKNYLCVTYWGGDRDVWAPDGIFKRQFSILAQDLEIVRESLTGEKGNRLFDVFYEIPETLTTHHSSLQITFQSDVTTMTGRIFGVRTTRENVCY